MFTTVSHGFLLKVSACLAIIPMGMAGCGRGGSHAVAEGPRAVTGKEHPEEQNEEPDSPSRPWKFLVLHHSATSSGSVQSIDAEHRQRRDEQGQPWRGIGYHFVIGNGQGMQDGEVQPTFRWLEQIEGAHAGRREFNHYGIGICLIGNFDQDSPSPAQLRASRNLIQELQRRFAIAEQQVLRHGDLKATACPGKMFSTELVVNSASGQGGPKQGDAVIPLNPAAPRDTEENDNVASTLGNSSAGHGNVTR